MFKNLHQWKLIMKFKTSLSLYLSISIFLVILSQTSSEYNEIEYVRVINQLGFDVVKTLPDLKKSNVAISPIALINSLNIFLINLNETFGNNLKRALNLELLTQKLDEDPRKSNKLFHQATKKITDLVLNSGIVDSSETIHEISTKMTTFSELDSFDFDKINMIHEYYKLEIEKIDKSSFINSDWFARKDKLYHLIKWVVKENLINIKLNDSALFLNKARFKGFIKTTHGSGKNFYNFGDINQQVKLKKYFMAIIDDFKYAVLSNVTTSNSKNELVRLNCSAVLVPVEGKQFQILFILPRSMDGIDELQSTLDEKVVSFISNSLKSDYISLRIPEFNIKYTESVKRILTEFNNQTANLLFGGELYDTMFTKKRLVAEDLVHDVEFDISEKVSSSTGITILDVSWTNKFEADHPFLFFVIHAKTNLIINMGRVNSF